MIWKENLQYSVIGRNSPGTSQDLLWDNRSPHQSFPIPDLRYLLQLPAIANGESLILETLYFVPSQLDENVLSEITPLYIYIPDRDLNAKRLNERQQYTHFNSPGNEPCQPGHKFIILGGLFFKRTGCD